MKTLETRVNQFGSIAILSYRNYSVQKYAKQYFSKKNHSLTKNYDKNWHRNLIYIYHVNRNLILPLWVIVGATIMSLLCIPHIYGFSRVSMRGPKIAKVSFIECTFHEC